MKVSGKRRPGVPRRRTLMPLCALLGVAVMVGLTYASVPLHERGDRHVDVLLVLGSPTQANGFLGEEQRWRVDEAVREYRNGRAPYILMSGGAVANDFTEAVGMAEYAVARGVPAGALVVETKSRDTVENLRNSEAILRVHRWHRVEVISSEAHLHRAAVMLAGTGLDWQTHEAPTPGWNWASRVHQNTEEVLGTAMLRWCGVGAAPVLHWAKVAEVRFEVGMQVMASVLEGWRQ